MENEFLKSRSILRPRPWVTEKFEVIDAEYAVYQESGDEHVPSIVICAVDGSLPVRFYESRSPRIGDSEKAWDIVVYVQKSFNESVRRTGTGGSTRTWRPGASQPGRSSSGR